MTYFVFCVNLFVILLLPVVYCKESNKYTHFKQAVLYDYKNSLTFDLLVVSKVEGNLRVWLNVNVIRL